VTAFCCAGVLEVAMSEAYDASMLLDQLAVPNFIAYLPSLSSRFHPQPVPLSNDKLKQLKDISVERKLLPFRMEVDNNSWDELWYRLLDCGFLLSDNINENVALSGNEAAATPLPLTIINVDNLARAGSVFTRRSYKRTGLVYCQTGRTEKDINDKLWTALQEECMRRRREGYLNNPADRRMVEVHWLHKAVEHKRLERELRDAYKTKASVIVYVDDKSHIQLSMPNKGHMRKAVGLLDKVNKAVIKYGIDATTNEDNAVIAELLCVNPPLKKLMLLKANMSCNGGEIAISVSDTDFVFCIYRGYKWVQRLFQEMLKD
jgi:hypothetical protein